MNFKIRLVNFNLGIVIIDIPCDYSIEKLIILDLKLINPELKLKCTEQNFKNFSLYWCQYILSFI